MHKNELENFLREQIYFEIQRFKDNERLTETERDKKIVALLTKPGPLNEGIMDSVLSIVGSMPRLRKWLAKKVVAWYGVPRGHFLNKTITDHVDTLEANEIKLLLAGDRAQTSKFADVLTGDIVETFKKYMPYVIGLNEKSRLGGPLSKAMVKAVSEQDFASAVKKGLYSTFVGFDATEPVKQPEPMPDADDIASGVETDKVPEPMKGREPEPEAVPEPTAEPEAVPEPTAEPEAVPEPTAEPDAIPDPVAADAGVDDTPTTGVDDKLKDTGTTPEKDADEGKVWSLYWMEDGKYNSDHPDFAKTGMVNLDTRKDIEDKIKLFKEKYGYEGPYYILAWQETEDGGYVNGKIMPMEEHPDWATETPAEEAPVAPDVAEEPATDDPAAEEPTEMTAEQKLQEMTDFVKRFTPGGAAGVVKNPEAEGLKKGWIFWIKTFSKYTAGPWNKYDKGKRDTEPRYSREMIGQFRNPDALAKLYSDYATAQSDEEKIKVLRNANFITEAGFAALQANRSGNPASDLEDAKATGDAKEVAAAAAATVADANVDSETKESAKQDLEAAIEDIPQEDETPPAEEDLIDVEELEAGLEEPEVRVEPLKEPETEEAEADEAEAEAAVQDTEADAADAAADDLERAAANEPEDTALKKQAADARKKANQEREQADEAGAYEEPTWQKNITSAREKVLKAALAADPEGSEKLYRRGVNDFIDRMMDNWEVELRDKAEKAKVVAQTKKMTAEEYFEQNKNKYATEVWPGEVAKQLRGIEKSIKEKGSTTGLEGIFNFKGADGKVIEVVPKVGEEVGATATPEEPETKKYNQINVELYDDKTVVLTDRSMRGKIKRSKLGEGMLSEMDWSTQAGKSAGPTTFRREGVTVVELPPIPVEKLAKIRGWGTATSGQKLSLTDEVYKLLKQKAESDPEAVEDFDLGSDEETGKPNIVIMSLSTPTGERDKWSGVFDHRTPATPELKGELKALYDKLARKYIRKTTDKKENVVAGTFNNKAADRDYSKGVKTVAGKKIKKLADEMGVEYTDDDLEYYMADIVKRILIKGGSLVPEEPKEKPTTDIPPVSPEEEEAMEAGFEDFITKGGEGEEELDEVLKISDDLLRRLLA